jgi:uncharacterized RmlC-like cupin family protein
LRTSSVSGAEGWVPVGVPHTIANASSEPCPFVTLRRQVASKSWSISNTA